MIFYGCTPHAHPFYSRGSDNSTLTEEDGIPYRQGWLWVPKGLIAKVLGSEHDSKVAGHFGLDKTVQFTRRNSWWPRMDADIVRYIQSCTSCQQDKSRRHHNYGLLSPPELPYALCKHINSNWRPTIYSAVDPNRRDHLLCIPVESLRFC